MPRTATPSSTSKTPTTSKIRAASKIPAPSKISPTSKTSAASITSDAASADDATTKGETSLNTLYALQIAAVKSGDIVTQKALGDDISRLMYQLTQFRNQVIVTDQTQIDALNTQLDKVTSTAQAAEVNLRDLAVVLSNLVMASKILDSLLAVLK
jgi:hypothetical protein